MPTRLTWLLAVALWFAGCDIIEAPYLDPEYLAQLPADEQCLIESKKTDPFGPGSPAIVKNVLLEEMTGHKCGNCPRASEVAYDLTRNVYPGRLFLVSVHAGPLAAFTPTASKYFTNFKTPAGDELFADLNNTNAVPFGMIDRVTTGNDQRAWQSQVEARLQEAPRAGIRIFNCYNPDSALLSTVVDVKYLADATATERLCVLLTEDGIVDWQTDYSAPNGSPDIPDYVHHDVYRAAINGTWGEPLSDVQVNRDQRFTRSYSYRLPSHLDPNKCRVVAFVYRFDTQEIHQVEVLPVVQ
ncbi:MAG: hypothetical protein OHK0039_43980 [Bacteroidia bacterium]